MTSSASEVYPRPFGRYELLSRLARGGMGELYIARAAGAAGWQKRVVIKRLLPHLMEDPEFRERFLDEARISVSLTHGNIVPVFDLGEVDGEYYLAMEYIDGWDLRTVIRAARQADERWPIESALHVVMQAARGLAFAHSRCDEAGQPLRIVHRDISPANLLLSRDGEVKIVDFGIASARSRLGATTTGRVQGKVAYMSPEQASGLPVDNRSDVFSLGVVLYELIAGDRPFRGDSDLEIQAALRAGVYVPLHVMRPSVPDAVCELVDRMLTQDVATRTQSADEVESAIMGVLQELTGPYTPRMFAGWLARLFPSSRRATGGLDALLQSELERLQVGGATPSAGLKLTPSTGAMRSGTPAPADVAAVAGAAAHWEQGTATIAPSAAMAERRPDLAILRDGAPLRRTRARAWGAVGAVSLMLLLALMGWGLTRPAMTTFEIQSQPAGANVFIDGVPAGVTTLRQRLPAGEHLVRLELAGYSPQERAMLLQEGPQQLSVELSPAPQTVTFESIPAGAQVFLQGFEPFVAGNSAAVLAERPLDIVMTLAGHQRYTDTVTLEVGQQRYVARMAPLEPAEDSTPALAAVDAGEEGPEPVERSVVGSPAEREDPAAVANLGPAEAEVGVPGPDAGSPPSDNDFATAQLQGSLNLQFPAPPFVGEVQVGSRVLGRWDRRPFELPAGQHELIVRNASHGKEFRATIQIAAGAELTQVVNW